MWFGRTGDLELGRILGAPEEMAVLKAALDKLEPPDPNAHARRCPVAGPAPLRRARSAWPVSVWPTQHGRIDPTHTVNIVIDAATLAGEFNPDGRSDILGGGSDPARHRATPAVQQLDQPRDHGPRR